MAPLSRVVGARALGASAELFSFLWQPRRRYGLAATCGLNFSAALAGEQWLLLQRQARSFARGETRGVRRKCRTVYALQVGSATVCAEGSCGAAEGRIRTAYDVLRSFCLLVSYRPLATRD